MKIDSHKNKSVRYKGKMLSIPESHNFIAIDKDGSLFSYYNRPAIKGLRWATNTTNCEIIAKVSNFGDWERSLQNINLTDPDQ